MAGLVSAICISIMMLDAAVDLVAVDRLGFN